MQPNMKRAWVEIDLGALRRNGASVAARTAVPILPMVKADAYGIGAPAAVRALEPLGPWGYGVATVEEGEELRALGVERPVVVFTPLLPDDFEGVRRARLTPTMSRAGEIASWGATGGGAWHFAIDTGMSRAGARWREVHTLTQLLQEHPPAGVFTHFHSADTDPASAEEQERRFREALRFVPGTPLRHVENSCAIVRRGRSQWDLVRPGLVLYGAAGGGDADMAPEAVVHLRARVISLRTVQDGETVSYGATWSAGGERRIATLAIGYADGYPRAMGNRAAVLVHGRHAQVTGVVTMDMTMIDVTDIPCDMGDVATLIGRDGGALLTVDEVAAAGGISPYELLTRLRSRVSRSYLEP
jgi:alanine racemase